MQNRKRQFTCLAATLMTGSAILTPFVTAPLYAETQAPPAATAAPLRSNPLIISNANGIRNDGEKPDETRLKLDLLDVAVRMDGRLADVTLTARIANPTTTRQEAQFTLALPDNAVVTGYALDIDGKMIDGVLIDLPKAKAVYEDEVRKNIDPGFASVTGNKFETRIYPIDEGKSRTITVHFVAPSDAVNGFLLPIRTAAAVGQYRSNVTVSGYSKKLLGEAVETKGRVINDAVGLSGGELSSAISVSEHGNGKRFFQINDASDAGKNPRERQVNKLRLYWDRSLSRRDDRIADELALVEKLIARIKPTTIEVIDFADGQQSRREYSAPASTIAYLKNLPLRGATSFKDVDNDPQGDEADLCLLFSDGAPTIEVAASFEPSCPLSAIASAEDANLARLGRWTAATRGQVVRLTGAAGEADRIVDQLARPVVAVVDVRDATGRKLAFRSLPSTKGWQLIGPLPDTDKLTVSLSGLGQSLVRRDYRIDASAVNMNDASGSLWAAEQLEALADDPQRREEMQQMAVSYKVAAPSMAFLVLESPDQYVTADIVPPAGFSDEWMGNYRKARQSADAQEAEERGQRLAHVLELWNDRKSWWAKSFTRPKRVPQSDSANAESRADVAPPPPAAIAPPPPPPPPQPSPVANAAVRRERSEAAADAAVSADATAELEAVVVTGTLVQQPGQQTQTTALTPVQARDEDGASVKMDIEDVLSDLPYLAALDKADAGARMQVFADQEKTFGHLPAFYLDTSEWFRIKGKDAALADSLMLSALELPSADDETRQIVAFRLQRAGRYDLAVPLLEQIAASTSFRPQPKRQLALALAERGKKKGKAGLADLQRAFKLLTEISLEPTDSDFDGIEVIALAEANALIPLITAQGGTWALDKRLVALLDTDVRVVVEWTNDDADLDLHVIEPTGELVYYGHKDSLAGGHLSNDMTDGYGPEEYIMKRALTGDYKVRIDGFSPDRLNPNGMGRVMVRLIRNFGRSTQQEQLIDADISFDRGGEPRDNQRGKPVATLKVSGGQ